MKTRFPILCILILCLCPVVGGVAQENPNVILIVTDDQGYGDMSCHGNPVLKTPNLDKLHAASARLTDFHVAPMCSPTRGQLMTGLDAMRNGSTAVCQGRSMMREDLPTMANFFADAGYATGHFGKWHLGDSYPHRPQDRGFQETLHHRAWGITSLADFWQNTYFNPVLEHNGTDKKYEGYCTDIFFDEAMNWIRNVREEKKPFFLYLPTNTPHVPNVCAEKYSAPYVGKHGGKVIPDKFYGMIANIDENLGELEEFLNEQGLRENTILIYMSDNGTQSTGAKDIFNAGMRDKKTSVYEGGHRVPCFVRWPEGNLAHGKDIEELTQVQDILPTLVEFCDLGVKPERFDGVSLASLLVGDADELPDRKLVVQYRVSGAPWEPAVVMWKKWRLVGGKELYHVGDDPGQRSNVAERNPEVVRAMADHYDRWYEDAKTAFDIPRWITVGSDKANPMVLYGQDWVGGYCDNRGNLIQATALGYWNVIVDQAGMYEFELRRWPRESEKPLAEGIGGPQDKGRSARPITAANLNIAGGNHTLDCERKATHVTFRVNLPEGKSRLSTTLMGEGDVPLCSSIYVYLRRLPESEKVEPTPQSERVPKGRAGATNQVVGSTPPPREVTLSAEDILISDFEGDSYGDWKVEGKAFGTGPTGPKGRVSGLQGERLVDTFLISESDKPVGSLTSPPILVERKYINFLIGGGDKEGKTCANLLVDGKVAQSAVGTASKDARQRKVMRWVSWDVTRYRGREVQFNIVDQASGGWGHIMVDQVFQSDRAPDQ